MCARNMKCSIFCFCPVSSFVRLFWNLTQSASPKVKQGTGTCFAEFRRQSSACESKFSGLRRGNRMFSRNCWTKIGHLAPIFEYAKVTLHYSPTLSILLHFSAVHSIPALTSNTIKTVRNQLFTCAFLSLASGPLSLVFVLDSHRVFTHLSVSTCRRLRSV